MKVEYIEFGSGHNSCQQCNEPVSEGVMLIHESFSMFMCFRCLLKFTDLLVRVAEAEDEDK